MKETSIYVDKAVELVMGYGPKVMLALLFLVVGWWVAGRFASFIVKRMEKHNVDPSLNGFVKSLTGVLLKILVVISTVGMIGVEMTSFIAILGAAGLAIGMALSGTLQNFAGGVMILIFKPFQVGDFIEVSGFSGTVYQIQIFNTVLLTTDNKRVIIPNASVSSTSMTNYSAEATRRVDFVFGIGYGDDLDNAKSVIRKIVDADSRVLKDPEAFVRLSELADSSVNITVRVWVNSADYWGVYFDTLEDVKKEFDKEGISIPYPQRDIHVHNVA